MITRKSAFLVRACFALIVLVLLGCGKKDQANNSRVEKPIVVAPTPTPAPIVSRPKLPPPTMAEVETAVHRIFGDVVTIVSTYKPPFIAGDFNGDQDEDLAVIVQPVAQKLNDVNSEFANWTIQDAEKAYIAPQGKRVITMPKAESVHVVKGEQVLAIIHGFGPNGWRNSDAKQAYLVKHAAAIFLGIASSEGEKSIQSMKIPIKTDIIMENRNNKQGFVFWTGSYYAWHLSSGRDRTS